MMTFSIKCEVVENYRGAPSGRKSARVLENSTRQLSVVGKNIAGTTKDIYGEFI